MIAGPFIPSQGYSSTYTDLTTPEKQATSLLDCYANFSTIVNRGSISSTASAFSGNPTVIGLGAFIDPNQITVAGATPLILAVVGTGSSAKKVFTGVLVSGAVTWTDHTGAVSLSNEVTEPWQFDSLNGLTIGVGNSIQSDPAIKVSIYTNDVAVLGGSPPAASCIKVVNNFCFLARNLGAVSGYSRVFWSSIGNPEIWPAANFVEVRVNDGDPIMALGAIGQDLIIFKRHSTSRLGTTTVSVAGAVTLGPLTTISDKIGCAGPGCAKSLPDGRLVFLDQFWHLTIFDGNIFTDVSQQPYPSPNVSMSNSQVAGTSGGVAITSQFSLAVDPYRHSVFVLQGTGSVKTNYAYDYLQNTWYAVNYSPGATKFISSLLVSDFVVPQALTSYLLCGDNNGQVWVLNGSSGPNALDGSSVVPSFRMSIKLPENFIPRTLMIPATLQSGASLSVTLGFNGTMNSSPSSQITVSNAALWNLYDVRATNTNIPRPLTMQILGTVTAGKTFTIYPFYLSDEVLSNVS